MVLALLALLAADVTPPADCTWMNTATASGILGGPSTLTLKPRVCQWTRLDYNKHLFLRIEIVELTSISTDYPKLLARCPAPSIALKTLGNEAVACNDSKSHRIVGRVRDQGFVIALSNNTPDVTNRVRRAADQVAGNLF